MNDDDLRDLVRAGESSRVEFKPNAKRHLREDIGHDICAFANDYPGSGQPGYLVIGVEDDGSPASYTVTDEDVRTIASMRSNGNIHPFPQMTVEVRMVGGTRCIVAEIQPARSLPVKFNGRVCIRIGSERRHATALEEQRLIERNRAFIDVPMLREVPDATLADLDLIKFRDYLAYPGVVPDEVRVQNHRPESHQLRALRFMTMADTPTVLGVLVLASEPTKFLPGAYIQFRKVEGIEITAPTLGDRRVASDLLALLKTLDEIGLANIQSAVELRASGPETRHSDYPALAIQEIIRNAVLHRSYDTSFLFTPIRMTWFSDRLEVVSPGGPFGIVTRANFGESDVTSYRNEPLAEVMQRLGYVQRYGVGIAQAQQSMASNGNPPIEFDVSDLMIRAILRT